MSQLRNIKIPGYLRIIHRIKFILLIIDKVDDFGFEKQESDHVELFQFKNFDIPDFPKNEYIK